MITTQFTDAVFVHNVTVPMNFNHYACIDEHKDICQKKKTTLFYDDNLNSKNFAQAVNVLIPGKTYAVKFISLLEPVVYEECVEHVTALYNGIFIGAQGLTLVDVTKLPKDHWFMSLDKIDTLWKDPTADVHMVPSVLPDSNGMYKWSPRSTKFELYNELCLLFFCEI